jgi:hypothetical protein
MPKKAIVPSCNVPNTRPDWVCTTKLSAASTVPAASSMPTRQTTILFIIMAAKIVFLEQEKKTKELKGVKGREFCIIM